jgi:hypothetical protein
MGILEAMRTGNSGFSKSARRTFNHLANSEPLWESVKNILSEPVSLIFPETRFFRKIPKIFFKSCLTLFPETNRTLKYSRKRVSPFFRLLFSERSKFVPP